jgi:hypothetical protein
MAARPPNASGANRSITFMYARLEHRFGRILDDKARRGAMDGPPGHVGGQRRTIVADCAGGSDEPAKHGFADRHDNRRTGQADRGSATEPRGCLQRDAAHGACVDM